MSKSKGLGLSILKRHFADLCYPVRTATYAGADWVASPHWVARITMFNDETRDAIRLMDGVVDFTSFAAKVLGDPAMRRDCFVRTDFVLTGTKREKVAGVYVEMENDSADHVAFVECTYSVDARSKRSRTFGKRVTWLNRDYVNMFALNEVWVGDDVESLVTERETLEASRVAVMPCRGEAIRGAALAEVAKTLAWDSGCPESGVTDAKAFANAVKASRPRATATPQVSNEETALTLLGVFPLPHPSASNPLPTAGDPCACRSLPCRGERAASRRYHPMPKKKPAPIRVRDLIASLQTLPNQDALVVLSSDPEGNSHSPIGCIYDGPGQYFAADARGYGGEVVEHALPRGASVPCIIIAPES